MSAVRFLDTNILLYGYDLDAPVKRAVALALGAVGSARQWGQPVHSSISFMSSYVVRLLSASAERVSSVA